MAYTTPRTFQTGDLVDDDMLNEQLKGNFDALSIHKHSGAAGDGSATLEGVDSVQFDDVSGTPTAPAANHIIIYSEGGLIKYRLPSGTVKTLATTSHTH